MKAIPIDYIKELIEVLQDCKQDEEEKRGGLFKNMLYCNARINCLNDLLKYWEEDSKEWTNESNINVK